MNIFKKITSSFKSLFKKKEIKPIVLQSGKELRQFSKPKAFKTNINIELKTTEKNVQERLDSDLRAKGIKVEVAAWRREQEELRWEEKTREAFKSFVRKKEAIEDRAANTVVTKLYKAMQDDYKEFKAERDAAQRDFRLLMDEATDEDKAYKNYWDNVEKNRIREEKREKRSQIIERIKRQKDPGYAAEQELNAYIQEQQEYQPSPTDLMTNDELRDFYEGAVENLEQSYTQVKDPFESEEDNSWIQVLSKDELEEIAKRQAIEDGHDDEDPAWDQETLDEIIEEMDKSQIAAEEEDEWAITQQDIIDSEEDQWEGETN